MIKFFCLNFAIIIVTSCVLGCANLARKAEIATLLIAMSKNEAEKQKAMREETLNYEKVKAYIENNKLRQGISARETARLFGNPVVIIPEKNGERWAYKPARLSWFDKEKIYLFFNKERILLNWRQFE